MAVAYAPPTALPSDLITVREGVALLHDTGHPVSKSTIQRWLHDGQLTAVVRYQRRDYFSASDLLIAHRDAVLAAR